jgi:diketogulonate reductase-like aldo/keto reductase
LGTWKEVSDSGAGGSGFSLVDLAADRSGTFSALHGTEEDHAGSVREWLAGVSQAEQLGVLPYSPLGGGFLSGKYHHDAPPPEGSRAARTSASTASLQRKLRSERNHAVAAAVRDVAAATGRTPAQVALNWVLHRPVVTAPIIGARSMEQLQENLGAAGWQLDDDDRRRLDNVSAVDLGYPHDWLEHYGLRAGSKPDRETTDVA